MVTLGMLSVGVSLATWLSGGIDVRILDPLLRAGHGIPWDRSPTWPSLG
jgi:hypothetical protein